MSDLKDENETTQRMIRLKEDLERQKRREPGTFERYNYEILDYLRYKFPEESESAIRVVPILNFLVLVMRIFYSWNKNKKTSTVILKRKTSN